MPSITKIHVQKNKNRVNLFIDNKFVMGLSLGSVLKQGLKVGQYLKEKDIEKLFLRNNFELFYNRVLNFLSFRPRSEKEIKDYINKNINFLNHHAIACHLRKNLEEKIIKKLQKLKLINDEDFAFWWLEQRLNFKPKGKIALSHELWQKGIKKEIIDKALNTLNNQSFYKMAISILEKKKKLYKNLSQQKLKQKLFSHLARRGFDFETAKKAIDEFLEK